MFATIQVDSDIYPFPMAPIQVKGEELLRMGSLELAPGRPPTVIFFL